jgi:hypothetical protein
LIAKAISDQIKTLERLPEARSWLIAEGLTVGG